MKVLDTSICSLATVNIEHDSNNDPPSPTATLLGTSASPAQKDTQEEHSELASETPCISSNACSAASEDDLTATSGSVGIDLMSASNTTTASASSSESLKVKNMPIISLYFQWSFLQRS